jgi:septal ring factor EnvC (AmiA/AmiB activator)
MTIKQSNSSLEAINNSITQSELKMESLKIEIKESKEHITVITNQNKELTSELKEFEK